MKHLTVTKQAFTGAFKLETKCLLSAYTKTFSTTLKHLHTHISLNFSVPQ